MWYDKSQLLSFNKIINFALGPRGDGKTYNAKKWCITDFKKKGKQFVWVRRYKEELVQGELNKFFDDIREEFPGDELTINGKTALINGKIAGFFIVLSTSMKKKSVPYPGVNKIIFDEFIVDKGSVRYIKNEVELFLELFSTVARLRDDVRALLIANAVSIVNPYFLYWNLKPDINKRFTVNNHIAVEIIKDTEYSNAVRQTRFGQLVEGTKYGDYAIDTNFLRDSSTFIELKPPTATFSLAFKYNGKHYGVWVDYRAGLMYINNQYDPSSYNIYAITKDDHEPNLLLIKTLSKCRPIERVLYAFQYGLVRFSDITVKSQFYEFISYFQR